MEIRSVSVTHPLLWLQRGWRDMLQAGWISVLHGATLAWAGGVLVLLAHRHFWLLAGAVSVFLVVAPVLATSLYALSRAMEQGKPANLGVVLGTWLAWQKAHRSKLGNDYWCLIQFGSLLGLAGIGWILMSAALIKLVTPVQVDTPLEFLEYVVVADHGFAFELWLFLGAVLAAPIYASSVITIPLLLDRRITLWEAVLTSWQAVLANPITLAVWAALIAGLTLLGMGLALVGLVLVIPVLGHASWHAYRDLVPQPQLPSRTE